MITKRERFNLWRKTQSKKDINIIDTAVLIESYFSHIKHLSQIKNDLKDKKTQQFINFNQYHARSFGVLVYTKSAIEEHIELSSHVSNDERKILTELSAILANVYDNPSKNAEKNAYDFINYSKKMVLRNIEDIKDLKQAKDFNFTLYFMFKFISVSIDDLGSLKKMAVNRFLNLNKIEAEVKLLINLIEEKTALLEAALLTKSNPDKSQDELSDKSLRGYLYGRFSEILDSEAAEEKKYSQLDHGLDDLSEQITAIITMRNKAAELTQKKQTINELLNKVVENEQKITGRAYFLELVNDSDNAFKTLLDCIEPPEKEAFLAKIKPLKNPETWDKVVSLILYGMSWATSAMTIAYRYVTPGSMQKALGEKLSITMDAECKTQLKILARESLTKLDLQLQDGSAEIKNLTQNLCKDNKAIPALVEETSTEDLNLLLKTNQEVRLAFNEYQRIFHSLEEKGKLLVKFKDQDHVLDHFIATHNNWLVKLSNFFARFCSWFKSNTAVLIDNARALKRKLTDFESEYKEDVCQELLVIENNPALPKGFKDKFKQAFDLKAQVEPTPPICCVVNKRKIGHMMANTFQFFKEKEESKADSEPSTSTVLTV